MCRQPFECKPINVCSWLCVSSFSNTVPYSCVFGPSCLWNKRLCLPLDIGLLWRCPLLHGGHNIRGGEVLVQKLLGRLSLVTCQLLSLLTDLKKIVGLCWKKKPFWKVTAFTGVMINCKQHRELWSQLTSSDIWKLMVPVRNVFLGMTWTLRVKEKCLVFLYNVQSGRQSGPRYSAFSAAGMCPFACDLNLGLKSCW